MGQMMQEGGPPPQDPSQGGGGGGPDPGMMAQLMAQLQGGDAQQAPPPDQGGDWLVEAINAVHSGMVEEGDPAIVSMLGAILNSLTTVQAKKSPSGAGGNPQGG